MNSTHVLALVFYSVGLVIGQMLFKLAAAGQSALVGRSLALRAFALMIDKYFIAAMVMYLVLSLAWVWILTVVPISKAYPFIALNFILVAGAGAALFSERLAPQNWVGLILIGAGIVLIAKGD
jgi:drug/metabolite transporter (DMT)-like permease